MPLSVCTVRHGMKNRSSTGRVQISFRGRLLKLLALAVCLAAVSPEALAQPAAESSACPRPLSILMERALAHRFDLSPGDSVAVGSERGAPGCPAEIAGVYEPDADPAELARERPRIVLRLGDLARLSGRVDEVDRFSVRLRDPARASEVAERLGALMPGTRVLRAEVVAARASTTFEVVQRFHRAIGLITITAGGVFLACIMTLKVQERRAQVAALRLVGISRRTLLTWLMFEAALVSTLGGMIGVGIGRLASKLINEFYQRAYQTSLEFSIVTEDTVRLGLALAVVLGLVAGAVGALRLLQVDALEEVGR